MQLAREGDPGCRRVVADVGRHIGSGVANLCNLLNPSRVVLGGDLAEAGELVLAPIRESVSPVRDPQRGAAALGASGGARGPCGGAGRAGPGPERDGRFDPSGRPASPAGDACLHLENEWHRCHLVKDLLLDVGVAAELTSSHLGRNDAASSGRFLK